MTREPAGTTVFWVTSAPAAIRQFSSMTAPLSRMAPIPMVQWSPTVQPCRMAP